MESKRPFFIAGVCFAVAILLVIGYTNARTAEVTAGFGEMVNVVVASRSIPEYGLIHRDDLTVQGIYKKFVQPQSILVEGDSPEATKAAFDQIAGKSSYVQIYGGEQITLTKLIHQDGKPVLDRQLEANTRAVTIQIAPHTGVGRLIRPGNRVDILAAVKYEQSSQYVVEIKTVFQNVLVLATGKNIVNSVPTRVNRNVLSSLETEFDQTRRKDMYQTTPDPATTSRPDDNYNYLTIQLPKQDAEKMLVIQHEAGDSALYFSLRNAGDMAIAKLDTTLLDQVLGPDSAYGQSKVKAAPLAPANPKFYDSQGGKLVPIY